MIQQNDELLRVAGSLIAATSDFSVERTLRLFAPDAVIDVPSTGQRFLGHTGIRDYIEQFLLLITR